MKAEKWPPHPHVFVEAGRLAKALGADDALVWPMFLVHVQDVNAQSVALLKRSAQRHGRHTDGSYIFDT